MKVQILLSCVVAVFSVAAMAVPECKPNPAYSAESVNDLGQSTLFINPGFDLSGQRHRRA